MARPTKLTDEIRKQAQEYADGGWQFIDGHNIPSVVGLARVLRVSKKTLYNWGNSDDEFLHTLDEISAEQEFTALNRALIGDYVAPIAKLVLANHDYSDKTQTDHVSSDGSIKISWEG
jgi:hypothetical protein